MTAPDPLLHPTGEGARKALLSSTADLWAD